MTDKRIPEQSHAHDPEPNLNLVSFVLLAMSWIVFGLSLLERDHIQSQFGPDLDMSDTFGRLGYISQQMLPFFCAILFFNALSGFLLIRTLVFRGLGRWGIAIAFLWVCTNGLLDPLFLLHLFFAGGSE